MPPALTLQKPTKSRDICRLKSVLSRPIYTVEDTLNVVFKARQSDNIRACMRRDIFEVF